MSELEFLTWLGELQPLREQVNEANRQAVVQEFQASLDEESVSVAAPDWPYLLTCASLLARSDRETDQSTALRIASLCLLDREANESAHIAASVVLDKLCNMPAIRLAEDRGLVPSESTLPLPLLLERTRRSLETSVSFGGNELVHLNRFQQKFWEHANDRAWLSVSAPTSAGKSFIVKKWIETYLAENPVGVVVYVVPTRALIDEVLRDLEEHFRRDPSVTLSCFPLLAPDAASGKTVFVLTQERLHLLLHRHGQRVQIDVLFVDEAHKVGDGTRGVLLQQAIEATHRLNPDVRVVFASPMTENPEILLRDTPSDQVAIPLASGETTVNQNLLWASQANGSPKVWILNAIQDGEASRVGKFSLAHSPGNQLKRLAFVAHHLGGNEPGNLVYVNGAADAERAAGYIAQLLDGAADCGSHHGVQALTDLCRKTIHKKYQLLDVLPHGVAFHYGNMPLLVRSEIERLFRENVIRYLVCTSTLLEGVNMPCRTLYVRGPRKGKQPLSSTDFWNLAGRAGRWGREFAGNIVCVDPTDENVWEDGAPVRRLKHAIRPATDDVLSEAERFVEFLNQDTPRDVAAKNDAFEYVASYLIGTYLKYGALDVLPWFKRMAGDASAAIESAVTEACRRNGLAKEYGTLAEANPGISPIAMKNLYEYFASRTRPLDELLPSPPESDDAAQAYVRVFGRIDQHLAKGAFGFKGWIFMMAVLVTDWMRGKPLPYLIDGRIRYHQKKGQEKQLPTVIRDTMSDVENIARFRAPKYLACYMDVLRLFLKDDPKALARIASLDFNIMLEFGVSQTTQVSLVSLGLSRTSSIALSDLIARDDLTPRECVDWLRGRDLEALPLPVLVRDEVTARLLRERTT